MEIKVERIWKRCCLSRKNAPKSNQEKLIKNISNDKHLQVHIPSSNSQAWQALCGSNDLKKNYTF